VPISQPRGQPRSDLALQPAQIDSNDGGGAAVEYRVGQHGRSTGPDPYRIALGGRSQLIGCFEHRCYLFLFRRGLQVSSLNEADPQPFGKIIASDPVRLARYDAVISQHEHPAVGVDAADARDTGQWIRALRDQFGRTVLAE
jgi:hypothetical protein